MTSTIDGMPLRRSFLTTVAALGIAGAGMAGRTVQAKLRDFPLVDDYITVFDRSNEIAPAAERMMNALNYVAFGDRIYHSSTGIVITSGAANKKIRMHPYTRIVIQSPANAGVCALHIINAGTDCGISGNGGSIIYESIPTVRLNHAVYLTGKSIIRPRVKGLRIFNSPNMGVAIYAGANGGVATGSYGWCVKQCSFTRTLGDGVHFENIDTNAVVRDIEAHDVRDDVVAVVNYTGPGSAPRRYLQSDQVTISGIHATGVRTATVSLGGVKKFNVSGITEKAAAGYGPFTVKLTHDKDYAVGNSDGIISDIATDGAAKIIAMDAGPNQTAFQQNIRLGVIKGKNISNQGVSLSCGAASADGTISRVIIENLNLSLLPIATGGAIYVSKTNDCWIEKLDALGGKGGSLVANNVGFGWGRMKLGGFTAGTTTPLTVAANLSTEAGALTIDATNCNIGPIVQSNTNVRHNGKWGVRGQAGIEFQFGSNTVVTGFYREVAVDLDTAVAAGATISVPYGYTAPASSGIHPNVQALNSAGAAAVSKNIGPGSLDLVFSSAMKPAQIRGVVQFRCG